MKIFNIFGKKRKKQDELVQRAEQAVELQRDNLKVAEKAAESSAEQGKRFLEIAEENTEIGKSLDSKSGQLIDLVEENEKTRTSLSQRDVYLREKEDDLAERRKEVRKQEINIVARISEVRRQESDADRQKSDVDRRDKNLDDERADIKKRESAAKKLAEDSRVAKENSDAKQQKMDDQKNRLDEHENDQQIRAKELDARQEKAEAVFKKAEKVDRDLAEKQSAFDKKCMDIEEGLNAKIEEYDRKIASIESVQGTVDSVKFDSSEEGGRAKIVVQEAIRQAKENLADSVHKFGELQEKYCEGTFRGFSVTIDELDSEFENLRGYRKEIEKYVRASGFESLGKITDAIDEYLVEADKSRKSWDFPNAYRCICYGVAICENFKLFLEILSETLEDRAANDDRQGGDTQSDEERYREILGVSPDATEKEIQKAFRKKAQEWHPDKNPKNKKEECEKKMKEFIEARDALLGNKHKNS